MARFDETDQSLQFTWMSVVTRELFIILTMNFVHDFVNRHVTQLNGSIKMKIKYTKG